MHSIPRTHIIRSSQQPVARTPGRLSRLWLRAWDTLMDALAPVGHESASGFQYGPSERERLFLRGLSSATRQTAASGQVLQPGLPGTGDEAFGELALAPVRSK